MLVMFNNISNINNIDKIYQVFFKGEPPVHASQRD